MSEPQSGPPQPDSKYVIAALQDELAVSSSNRIYLLSCINQMREEYVELQNAFNTAQAEWELERASLRKGNEDESPDTGE